MKKRLASSVLVVVLGLMCFSSLTGFGIASSSHLRHNVTADSGSILPVYGSVYQTINLDFEQLVKMPRSTVYAELYCDGALVDHGNWTGVKLGLLLEKAGLPQEATTLELRGTDGYDTNLSLSTAMREDVIIAYEKDGVSLAERTRLVIPGANGSEWISGITQIIIL